MLVTLFRRTALILNFNSVDMLIYNPHEYLASQERCTRVVDIVILHMHIHNTASFCWRW